jgi:hypothetical protein
MKALELMRWAKNNGLGDITLNQQFPLLTAFCIAMQAQPKVPDGWSIVIYGDTAHISSPPNVPPGVFSVNKDSSRFSERLLFALCKALVNGEQR